MDNYNNQNNMNTDPYYNDEYDTRENNSDNVENAYYYDNNIQESNEPYMYEENGYNEYSQDNNAEYVEQQGYYSQYTQETNQYQQNNMNFNYDEGGYYNEPYSEPQVFNKRPQVKQNCEEIAPKKMRIRAYLIDKIILLIPLYLCYSTMLSQRIIDTVETMINYNIDIINLLPLIAPVFSFYILYKIIYFLYYVVFAYYRQGQTIGKKICHIVLESIDSDNSEISFELLAKREMLYKFKTSFLGIGYIAYLFSKTGITWHDKQSKTVVVNEYE